MTITKSRLALTALAALSFVGLVGCSSATTASPPTTSAAAASTAAPLPRLASVDNFRDVAGADGGYQAGNKRMRPKVLYRSNALRPNPADLTTLNSLGITTVYDLRTTVEINQKPDILPSGAKYVRHNIVGDNLPPGTANLANLKTPQQARDLLIQANQQFVTHADERAQIAAAITDIVNTQRPQLIHCTSGKDRTGWVAAVIRTLIGVDQRTVFRDYLLTNQYSAKSIDAAAARAAQQSGPELGEAVRVVSGVFPEALQAGIDAANTNYGSVDGYARNGLGLSNDTIAKLKAKLLV